MTPRDAIALLDNPLLRSLADSPHPAPTHWADLGAGSGTFTFALAQFLMAGSTIDAVDLSSSIQKQTTKNNIHIQPITADFTDPTLQLTNLDGIVIANALHYVEAQPAFIRTIHQSLKPGGTLIIIEYNTDTPVPRWVPYPLSFTTASNLITPPALAGTPTLPPTPLGLRPREHLLGLHKKTTLTAANKLLRNIKSLPK